MVSVRCLWQFIHADIWFKLWTNFCLQMAGQFCVCPGRTVIMVILAFNVFNVELFEMTITSNKLLNFIKLLNALT